MTLRPIESEAEAVDARDGTRRRIRRWPARRPFMGMLLLPTWGSHGARYERFAAEVALHGVHVEALDLVGHGESDGPRGAPAWEVLRDDVEDRLLAIRRQLVDRPVALYGHGLGGLVALDYLVSDRPAPDLAVLVAPSLTLRKGILPGGLRLPWQRTPDVAPVIDDVGQLAKDPDLQASWRSDPLVVRGYAVPFLRTVVDVQARVVPAFDRLTMPMWIARSGLDPIAPEPRPVLPSRGSSPDRWDTFASGHDSPNDQGWHDRARDFAGWLERAASRHWPSTLTTVESPRSLERYDQMSRAEATAEFDAYVTEQPERIARLEAIVQRRGGPALDCDPEALDRLGAWVLEALEWSAPGERPPDWVQRRAGHEISAESAALVEGVVAHLAACLRTLEPEVEWRLCTQKIDAYYHRPLLQPLHLLPETVSAGILIGAGADPPRTEQLGTRLVNWRALLSQLRQRGPGEDDPLPLDEIVVDPVDPAHYGGRFNATIWIPEGAEAVLGEERFEELPRRLARLKGVLDLVHEDREVFPISVADGQDLDELRRRVVGVVRRLRDAAERETDE
jgi:alpha-beta hydrolase superfamily lysophospholipase